MPNATGQTLRSLYLDLPHENLLELVYTAGGESAVTIPATVAPIDLALRGVVRAIRKLRGSGGDDPPTALNDAIKVDGQSTTARVWKDLRAAADVSPVRISRGLLAQIQDFGPDVIYTLLGNVRIMKLAIALSEELDIPIVPHFMDDWPGTLYPNGELGGRARSSALRSLDRVLDRSPVLVCIGDMMAAEYRQRYARPVHVAAFGIEEPATPAYTARRSASSRRLVYAGGLHLGRQHVLEWVASCLEGSDWMLEVYAPTSGTPTPNIRYMPPVAVGEISTLLAAADALLFVESLEPSIADYTRLSVSTKSAQYVGANRPAILIGPARQASIELLSENLAASIHIDRLSDASAVEIQFFLESGLPACIPARKVPPQFSGRAMRESMIAAIESAAEIWTSRGNGRG
ncbi:MAG TPA: hypothetical protein DIW46_08240 [Microbacterium sp.]|nr:hypothetical protein [Microbacterium sp.]